MTINYWEKPLFEEPDDWIHSSSAAGVIGPPAAAIWSLNALRTNGSEEVLGSISETDSIFIALLLALWREPMIE